MRMTCLLVLTALLSSNLLADDATIEKLQQQNELLQAKLEAANLKIEKLEKEIAALKTGKRHADPVEEDLFEEGAIWSGMRTVGTVKYKCTLEITSRDKSKFNGEFVFTAGDLKEHKLDVSGTAPNTKTGAVIFFTNTKAALQQKYVGKLSGGQISLDFQGQSNTGGPVKGTVTLSQND